MEADISIWRKTGHFYFALTRVREVCKCEISVDPGQCLIKRLPDN